jgi:electron transport complex protein RnfC
MSRIRRSLWFRKHVKPWFLRLAGRPDWATALHALPGGIVPLPHKRMSLRQNIVFMPSQQLPLPSLLTLPLKQHQGVDATPVVRPGQYVYKYQLIAEAENEGSVRLHAPSSGFVSAIDYPLAPVNMQSQPTLSWQQTLGQRQSAILLETDGEDAVQPDRRLQPSTNTHWSQKSRSELRQAVFEAGICGLGGAGFPTAIKLGVADIKTLIINGAECEPYITADEALMREYAAEIVEGAKIIQRICGAESCVIGIEDDKHDAIDAIQTAIAESATKDSRSNGLPSVKLVLIPAVYPSGGEKQLIRIITGLQPMSGQRPFDVGVLCHSVATARAVFKAVIGGEPLTSRVTTITGSALSRPVNVEVLIGTPASHLLEFAGLDSSTLERLLVGGPLMGYAVDDLHTPVIKTSNCLLAGSQQDIQSVAASSAPHRDCIRCDFCAPVCPVKLQPQSLYFAARHQRHDSAEQNGIFDCIECGACAAVCPSHIPLVAYYRDEKALIRVQADTSESSRWQSLFEKHQQRLSDQAVMQQQRKLDKLAQKLDLIAEGGNPGKKPVTESELAASPKSAAQIKSEIEAAVARTRARKAELLSNTDAKKDVNP